MEGIEKSKILKSSTRPAADMHCLISSNEEALVSYRWGIGWIDQKFKHKYYWEDSRLSFYRLHICLFMRMWLIGEHYLTAQKVEQSQYWIVDTYKS